MDGTAARDVNNFSLSLTLVSLSDAKWNALGYSFDYGEKEKC